MNVSIHITRYILIVLLGLFMCGCSYFYHEEVISPSLNLTQKAHAAVKNQEYKKAEELYFKEMLEMEKEPRWKGRSFTVYVPLSIIYTEQGRYKEAAEARIKGFVPFGSYEWVEHFGWLAEIYLKQGAWDEAWKTLELAQKAGDEFEKREPHNAGFTFRIITPYIGDYYTCIGNYEKGEEFFNQFLDMLIERKEIGQDIAEYKCKIAFIKYCAEDYQAAEKLYREAAGLNQNAFVGFPTNIATNLIMLAKIAERQGKHEEALKHYQSARKSLHMYRSLVYKTEEADVLNQIGRFWLKQGKLEESEKAYRESIRMRMETQGPRHPDYAEAIKGLGGIAAARGEWTSATAHATEALKIVDNSLVPTHPRLANFLLASAAIHEGAGNPEQAKPLYERIELLLQNPLGPWKQDFLETAVFYAGLLKKSGQPAAAARLEQLLARQKDRR